MRSIGVVTVARSDYTIYLPVLRAIAADPRLELRLIAAGMHLAPEFGLTARAIEEDGWEIAERVEMLLSSDTAEGIAKSIGLGVIGFAQAFARSRPDLLVLMGDRFEMLAAASAALPFNLPIAHLHGGEATEGLIDEAIRHSITKMSHLHFVSTEAYARRVVQMGEAPWRVTVSGAPALDNLRGASWPGPEDLERRHGIRLDEPPVLVTFHPLTLEYERTETELDELLAALEQSREAVVFTYPNADTRGRAVIRRIESYVASNRRAQVVANLGTSGYYGLLSYAKAMVGNSSSGIIEAASFELPVVNIGDRQRGRIHGENVIDVEPRRDAILEALQRAVSPDFRASLKGLENPYGDGHAAERIVERLRDVPLDAELLVKRFHNLETA